MQTNVSAIAGFQPNRAGSVRYIGTIRDGGRNLRDRPYQDSYASLSQKGCVAVSLPVGALVPPCSEELMRALINELIAPELTSGCSSACNCCSGDW